MEQSTADAGTIAALMIRLKEYRLPRAKRMLEKVNGGDTLSHDDIAFLERVYNDSRTTQALVKRNPEYHQLIARTLDLYTEIITKVLDNEKTSSGTTKL
jgi:hypothetical protein